MANKKFLILLILAPALSSVLTYFWTTKSRINMLQPAIVKFKNQEEGTPQDVFMLRPDGILVVNLVKLIKASENMPKQPQQNTAVQ